MSVDLEILENRVIFHCKGVVTFDETFEANTIFMADARADTIDQQLIDFSEMERYELTEEQAMILAHIDKSAIEYMRPTKIAFVYPLEPVHPVILSYLANMEDTAWEASVFKERDQAEEWLSS